MVTIRPKSVLKPPAQINKLLQPGNTPMVQVNDFGSKVEKAKARLGHYYELFMLMLYGGLRISEALNVKHSDINLLGQVFIHAAKGSVNRLVSCAPATKYLLRCKTNSIDPFIHFDRFAAYRHLQRIGVQKLKKGRVNASVTHALRDEYVKINREIVSNNSDLSKITGHKVAKNVEYYGKD